MTRSDATKKPERDDGEEAFEVTPEEESELLEAIAACERGETITAAELFERLGR